MIGNLEKLVDVFIVIILIKNKDPCTHVLIIFVIILHV